VLDDGEVKKADGGETGTYRQLVRSGDRKTKRYVWPSQSRTSLLAWKLFGRRTDGFPDKVTPETKSDYASHLARGGDPYAEFKGSIMPPPDAVAGTYKAPDGRTIKVEPLTDEGRRTILRWIDLGCPIDLDYDAKDPARPGRGWMLDDQRPTLAVTLPRAGRNDSLGRILVGMHDYGSGVDEKSFTATADFDIDDVPAGQELAGKFRPRADGVWEWELDRPVPALAGGVLTVAVKDRQGNVTKVERTIAVRPASARGE
jgi:hypothetical protein